MSITIWVLRAHAPAAPSGWRPDNSGSIAVVTHPNPAAVAMSNWQEWTIPLSELGGINLNSVRTMYIGVGDRDNPTAGGAGLIFVDDILVGHPGQ